MKLHGALKRGMWSYIPEERAMERERFNETEIRRKQIIELVKKQNEEARAKQ
jgi:hypothetical protein